uniref:Uncharacterized protein n=1 Tax=Glossina palpalis gambiensis TaxID=67801 RepID=A0A1B0C2B9_9MUSC
MGLVRYFMYAMLLINGLLHTRIKTFPYVGGTAVPYRDQVSSIKTTVSLATARHFLTKIRIIVDMRLIAGQEPHGQRGTNTSPQYLMLIENIQFINILNVGVCCSVHSN